MYLIIYTGKNAKTLQIDNSAEIPNTYKIQPFRVSQIIATSVPKGAGVGDQRSEVRMINPKFEIVLRTPTLRAGSQFS